MILNLGFKDEFVVQLYPLGEEDEMPVWTIELKSDENGTLSLFVMREEADHDGEVFSGEFKREFKDDESCEDIKVNLPCGMNSFNDKLKVVFKTKHHETDNTIYKVEEYDHWVIEKMGDQRWQPSKKMLKKP